MNSGQTPISVIVLGQVLAEARHLTGRSPEQVAGATGLSGRTVRRLEMGAITQPHRTTLEVLAEFYALDRALLRQLVEWRDLDERALLRALRELDGGQSAAEFPLEQLAMRVARRGVAREAQTTREWPRDPELSTLAEDFLALDRRRQLLARVLLHDLRVAGEQEARGR